MSDGERRQYYLIFNEREDELYLIVSEVDEVEEELHNENQSWWPGHQQLTSSLRVALILLFSVSLFLLVYPQGNLKDMLCNDGSCHYIFNASCKNAGFLLHINLGGIMEDVGQMRERMSMIVFELERFFKSKAAREEHVWCQSHRLALAFKNSLGFYKYLTSSQLWLFLCKLGQICIKLVPY